jgi:hypothetical protein
MNARVKIIKRAHAAARQSFSHGQPEKTGRQREREIANTVKTWIVELAQSRNALTKAQSAQLRFRLDETA